MPHRLLEGCFDRISPRLLNFGAQKHLHVEDPTPSGPLNNYTTNKGPQGGTNGDCSEENPEDISSLSKRNKITNDELDHHLNASAANALNGAACDKHRHIPCAASDTAAKSEKSDSSNHEPSSAKDVGCLAKKWLECSAEFDTGVSFVARLFDWWHWQLLCQEIPIDDLDVEVAPL